MSVRPTAGGPKLRRLNMGQVFILLAVVSAVLTMIIFKKLSTGGGQEKTVEIPTKPLVVASQQLFAGEVISSGSVKVIDWPEKHYPKSDVYEDPSQIIGRVIKKELFPEEPIYKLNLAGSSSMGGLPVVIPPGYRAITISISESKGVAGFIKPGNHVDVVGTFEFENKSSKDEESFHVTQTVLQNVQVLAIAQEMFEKKNIIEESLEDNPKESQDNKSPDKKAAKKEEKGSSNPAAAKGKLVSSVTLAVSPEQAEKLTFADDRGDLRLTLRPENDNEELSLLGVLSEDVVPLQKLYEKMQRFGSESSLPASSSFPALATQPVQPSPSHSVEVIEGITKSTASF